MQYDMALNCFERALSLADDENMADVWFVESVRGYPLRVQLHAHMHVYIRIRYNIGQISIGIGDLGLAYQAFKIGVSINSNHAECYNNLGVRSGFLSP